MLSLAIVRPSHGVVDDGLLILGLPARDVHGGKLMITECSVLESPVWKLDKHIGVNQTMLSK